MGFGTLFSGYLTLFFCRGVDIFPDIIAYIIILAGMRKLTVHCDYFRHAMYTVYALLGVGLVNDTMQIVAAVTDISFGILQSIVSLVSGLALLAFTFLLCRAVIRLARELGLGKLVSKATFNIILAAVYCICTAVSLFYRAPTVVMVGMLLGFVWMLHGASLIYGCYRYICLEGDEDMETAREDMNRLTKLIFREKEKPQDDGAKSAGHGKKKKKRR